MTILGKGKGKGKGKGNKLICWSLDLVLIVMFRFSSSVNVRLLRSSNYLLVFDTRSGDTMAFEYNDAAIAEKLLEEPREQEFFESALIFKALSFKKATDLNVIERV